MIPYPAASKRRLCVVTLYESWPWGAPCPLNLQIPTNKRLKPGLFSGFSIAVWLAKDAANQASRAKTGIDLFVSVG